MLHEFKKLMAARFFFTFGISVQAVIVGWRMYDLTHDPLSLGLIGLTEAVPAIGLALFAGYIVDRSRPLAVYRRVLEGSLVAAMVLMVAHVPAFGFDRAQQIFSLYLSSFVSGLARAFSQPSLYAAVPRIVPRNQLSRASAWMTSALQIARISGPGLGGLVFGYFGMAWASAFTSFAIALAIASTLLIEADIPAPAAIARRGSIRTELFSGVSYVFGHPILLSALSLDMISVLFGGVTALLPIYAGDILHIGPQGLGLLRAAPAVGAAVMSILFIKIEFRKNAGPWLFMAVAGFGVSILVFGVSTVFWLSALSLGLSGAFDSVSMVIRTSAVQLASPDDMRGRISAVNSIFIGSSNEIGEFESGVAAKLMGTVPSVIFGGVVCLATVAVTAWLAPTLRKMDLTELKAS
jgi:MFS family permease